MNEAIAKRTNAQALYAQRDSHLGGLPAHVLLDLARNESAPREWRKAAVELLLDKGFAQANHPELAAVVMEIRAERAARVEVEAVVETAVEQDLSGGSHFDFGGQIPGDGRMPGDGSLASAVSTTNSLVDVTASIASGSIVVAGKEVSVEDASTLLSTFADSPVASVTTQNLLQDEVFPPSIEQVDHA